MLGLSEAEGLRLLLGLKEAEALGDNDPLGEIEAELLELGELEELGLIELDGEVLAEGEREVLAEGETEVDGEIEAEGERLTPNDCIEIIHFSVASPVTFLYSKISPKTVPRGCGPYNTVDGRGRIELF